MTAPCDLCGTRYDDPMHRGRCGLFALTLANLLAEAKTLPNPPTEESVRELWFHARRFRDDGEQAARWIRTVLECGWRAGVEA